MRRSQNRRLERLEEVPQAGTTNPPKRIRRKASRPARSTAHPTPPTPQSGSDAAGAPVPAAPFPTHQNGDTPSGATPQSCNGRDDRGRFVKGHSGGPGRPRRAIESEYLAVLGSVVSLDYWQKVCQTALRQAIEGDDKARLWLSKYVLGDRPTSLKAIAAEEVSSGKYLRLGENDVLVELASRMEYWVLTRYMSGSSERYYDLAERRMAEARGEVEEMFTPSAEAQDENDG